jgi:hypothetical protein
MENIQIELSKIKANPFKQFINNGKLDKEIIEKLKEGYKQTTFHENLCARRNEKDEIEIIYGHHRLEACKQFYGKNYKISLRVYSQKEFSDEKMLIDMIRENLTNRGDDYKDLADSIMLVKRWLGSDRTSINSLIENKNTKKKKQEIKPKDIAEFISKQGKTISVGTILKILSIEENLDEEIKEKVSDNLGRGRVRMEEGKIGTSLAHKIASIDKKEQKEIFSVVEKNKANLMSEEKTMRLLTKYKEADKDLKEKVRKKEIELEELPIEMFKKEVKKKAEESLSKDKSKIKVTFMKQYQRQAGNLIGETNDKILKTCAFFDGLQKQGILYDLDWNTISKIIEAGQTGGKQYTKFMENIIGRIAR